MFRKIIVLLLALALLLPTVGLASAAEPVTITFWDENAGPMRTPLYDKMIADFEAANPDIKVEYVGIPWASAKEKYDLAIDSNTMPDCADVPQAWLSNYVLKEVLEPLDAYFEAWDKKDTQISGFLDANRKIVPDGKLYGLVNISNMTGIWYRPDLFAEKGIGVPQTWDDFFAAVEETTDVANGMYGFSLRGGAGSSTLLQEMLYSYSGIKDFFDENGKSTINNLDHLDFLKKFVGMYKVYTAESDINNGYKEMVAAFDTGAAAMILHNLGSYGEHMDTLGEGKFAFTTFPASKQGYRNLFSTHNGYSIFANSDKKDAAWRFISFLCEAEQVSYWNENVGAIPPNTVSMESDWAKNTPHIQVVAEAFADPETSIISAPFNLPTYADVHNNILGPALQEVLIGAKTPEAFLELWETEMNAAYESAQ